MNMQKGLSLLACAALALGLATGVADAQCSGTNPITCTSADGTISVTGTDSSTPDKASVYPSAITVTASGTISNVVVRLNGFNANGSSDTGTAGLGILLVHTNSSKNLEILSSPGDATNNFGNVTFYMSDAAVSGLTLANTFGYMPSPGDPCGSQAAFPGTNSGATMNYRPSSYDTSSVPGSYPGSGVSSPTRSGPCTPSSGTLNGIFAGDLASGTWNLYVVDDLLDVVSISNWSLIITTASLNSSTTTLSSSINPSFTSAPNNGVTLTAGVTSGSGPVTGGTVAFMDGSSVIAGCGGVPLSNAAASCNTSFTTEGFHSLSAVYSGSGGFATSTGTMNQFVENHTTVNGNTYCNTGAINVGTANGSGTDTQPYPSVINVPNITNAVSTVQLVLNGLSMSETLDLSMLLVAPDGTHALDFFDSVGGAAVTSSTTVTFSDGASGLAPNGTGGLASPTASYQPTSYRSSTSLPPPSFLSPPSPGPQVPASFSVAEPGGGISAKTFLEAFNGATSDGNWTLYVYDHANPNTASIANGWCLSITPGTGLSTTTSVSGSPNAAAPNGAVTGSLVTVTATVKNGATLVNTGSVTFTENGQQVAGGPLNPVNVATSGPTQGQASFTTSSLPQGDHNILATYTDSSNTYSESFRTYVQRVDNAATVTVNGTQVTYCNTGKITIPNPTNPSDLGAGTPNPSNINVNNLFGTIHALSVTLNGYSEGEPEFLTSLLVGPAGNTGATLDFFSGAGGGTPVGPFNLAFADSASSVPSGNGNPTAGTYKPTANNVTDTFTPSASNLYPLPGTYQYAQPRGSSTLASVYTNSNPNGNWDLYFYQNGNNPGGGLSTGWCLNFTQNPPALSIAKSHTGNFEQGQQGAQFAITVTNNGPGTAGGPIPITVVDTLATGLTPATSPGAGTDWSCSSANQTITCTNSDVVASGSSYPTLTLNVNVASNATGPITNSASVNGSGNTTAVNSNTDTVTIVAPPSLSISKSPVGTFTQGSTAIWDLVVSNTAPNSATSGTVTVVDTLPTGYTMASFTGTGWNCTGTNTITCTSTTAVSGGNSYPTIQLTVNVPTTSATSVTNNAGTFGGGDLNHADSGHEATAFSTVTVVQVANSITATAGSGQSANTGSAFTPLQATVKDAAGNPISGLTVTFTGPGTGASVVFGSTSSNTDTGITNSSGVASSGALSANATVGGPYNVTATVPGVPTPANFSLTNGDVAAMVTSLSSTTANGTYGAGASIAITVSFSKAVTVTGTPLLALNSAGSATYTSGSGTSTLTFSYTVAPGQNSGHLDAASTNALTLNGGTITDSSGTGAILTLPAPGAAGSLGANSTIVIDTTSPTVVSYNVQWGLQSYNVIGTSRNRLPWQITSINVVFSKPIASGNVNSLSGTGVTTTGFSGLGTNTLTWTVNPLALGNFATTLAGSGANALKDAEGNALAGGAGFNQNLKILYGDFNDDGNVNSQDMGGVNGATNRPYNILADMNGDGTVSLADVQIVRTRVGTSLP